jgi:hypothetical protein
MKTITHLPYYIYRKPLGFKLKPYWLKRNLKAASVVTKGFPNATISHMKRFPKVTETGLKIHYKLSTAVVHRNPIICIKRLSETLLGTALAAFGKSSRS